MVKKTNEKKICTRVLLTTLVGVQRAFRTSITGRPCHGNVVRQCAGLTTETMDCCTIFLGNITKTETIRSPENAETHWIAMTRKCTVKSRRLRRLPADNLEKRERNTVRKWTVVQIPIKYPWSVDRRITNRVRPYTTVRHNVVQPSRMAREYRPFRTSQYVRVNRKQRYGFPFARNVNYILIFISHRRRTSVSNTRDPRLFYFSRARHYRKQWKIKWKPRE